MRLHHISRFLLICLSCMTLNITVTQAADGLSWSIVEISGSVTITDEFGQRVKDAHEGIVLVPPVSMFTGSDGRLVLVHGQDHLTVSSNTRLDIPQSQSSDTSLITRIKQSLGSILYQVGHRLNGGFEVDTPFLVSVVKGTTFNILVTEDATTVALIEGQLLVHTPDSKLHLMLEPGQAAIKSEHDDRIILKDQQSRTAPVIGPVRVVDDSRTKSDIINNDYERDTKVISSAPSLNTSTDLSIDTIASDLNNGEPIRIDDSAIRLDTDPIQGVDVDTSSVNVSGVSASVDSTTTINVDAVSVDSDISSLEGDVTPPLEVDSPSLNVDETSLGIDSTPGVDVGSASIDTGNVSLGDINTPNVGVDTSLSIDSASGTTSSVDIGVDDTPVVNIDVTDTNVDLSILPDSDVTTITDTLSDTAGAAIGTIKKLPGL